MWSTFILDRASSLPATTLEKLFTGFCPISGSPLPDDPHTRYWEVLNRVDGSYVSGIAHHCCWPCLCDEQDWTRVDKKTIVTSSGKKTYDFIVIGDPCKNKEQLEKPFVDPFSGASTNLQQEAPEVSCKDGSLSSATLSDGGFPIIGMFFTSHASVAGGEFNNATKFNGECAKRKAAGYNSGMGMIFEKVARINPIDVRSLIDIRGLERKSENVKCKPRQSFENAKSACAACQSCRSENKCPCSYFTEKSNTFFCFDQNAPDLLEGSDLHNKDMHCNVVTDAKIHTCVENAVQSTGSTKLYSPASSVLTSGATLGTAALLVLLVSVLSVVLFRRLPRRHASMSSDLDTFVAVE
jgi:hypothetical protein